MFCKTLIFVIRKGSNHVAFSNGSVSAGFDGNGLSIGGSFEVGDNWHVFGSYSSTDFGLGIDVNELQVGAGYHVLISDNTSFFTDLSLVRAEVDVGILGSVDDDGYGLTIGLLVIFDEDVVAYGIGGRYYFGS